MEEDYFMGRLDRPNYALPADHPILQCLLTEIEELRKQNEILNIRIRMDTREIELLAEKAGKKNTEIIRKKVWGR